MILVQLEIEDYKQFAGKHCFTPAPDGIVAVIGQNGAGKTTLFEAIEWCLYQPREISADEVPPRGKAAKPRVQLTLLDPRTGARFVIVRTLNKSKVADAEIYREDDDTSRIVKGSRQTTDYVAKTLIGLSHRAFVSTFFTRQKELTFFGDMKETERRREVGRLLGMEIIREAQKLIGDDRLDAQNQARLLELQGREASEGRDFAAELKDAEASVSEAAERVSVSELSLKEAESAHAVARAVVERLVELERRESALTAAIERTAGDIRAANARRDAAQSELARMYEAASERAALSGVAASIETHRTAVQMHETARDRHMAAQRAQTDLARAEKTLADAVRELEHSVKSVGAADLSGWYWRSGDAREPVAAAMRLIDAASTVDLAAVSAEADAFLRAEKFGLDLETARAQAANFRSFLEKLKSEHAALLAGGDPHTLRDDATRRRQDILQTIAQSTERIQAIGDKVEQTHGLLIKLTAQEDGATCPTCAQPIDAKAIEAICNALESQMSSLESERATLVSSMQAAEQTAKRLESELRLLGERATQLDTLNGRIATGESRIADAEQGAMDIELALGTHLASMGRSTPPTDDEIDAARHRLEVARRLGSVLPLLVRLEAAARQATADAAELQHALAELGDVRYDPAAHDAARAVLKNAENAAARIEQIDRLLAERPAREAEIAAAGTELASLTAAKAEQEAARAALAFDQTALEQGREAEHAAVQAERAARDARAVAVAAHADTVTRRDGLIAEQQRIAKLIERADTRAREVGELDMMYREFNGFEQFVADRLTPQLSDYASELISAITEGKYDHVWFNSNYGVEVYDGADEKFDVAEFSGGERDVIALCARLALSRLIGGQANNPPGFMVLDEVFGSLDRERRAQVLETLGALAGTADAFHQLFIISHVDDVRSSPIFNEIWRVAEGPDGVSHLENLNLTGGFEEG